MAEKGKKLTVRDILNELVERTNSNMKRLRVLEENADTITSKLNTLESDIFEHKKTAGDSFKKLEERLSELDDRISRLETTIKEIIEQLKRVATTAKIKELEELIEIYNPLKSKFVTREEVERMIEERMR
ncbi:MAG: hypothetical protein DRP12_00520 [Candidatus Aenigmatarchaeota archaeon]|nr:MAG: hypothetical protein DRP12_00520 [Candidatus Aenigmarchaeota archaeon]